MAAAAFDHFATPALDAPRVELAAHDPAWVRRFARERDRIASVLGDRARSIEHVGSTAVPGLAAKPVIDVMLLVPDVDRHADWLPPLESLGYALRACEHRHRMLVSADGRVHVHAWSEGSAEARRHLAFRDRLRRSATVRTSYEELKRHLADQPWPAGDAYVRAHTAFLQRVLARAKA